MTIVLYGFRGRFAGNAEHEYQFPEVGDTHHCILFVSQQNEDLDFENAVKEISRYGFTDIGNLRGNAIRIAALNTKTYRGFAGFYEEALETGSSLVYYPNT